jgi:hypothetical protein
MPLHEILLRRWRPTQSIGGNLGYLAKLGQMATRAEIGLQVLD